MGYGVGGLPEYKMMSSGDLEPARDFCLDDLCKFILDPEDTVLEACPEPTISKTQPLPSMQASRETTGSHP